MMADQTWYEPDPLSVFVILVVPGPLFSPALMSASFIFYNPTGHQILANTWQTFALYYRSLQLELHQWITTSIFVLIIELSIEQKHNVLWISIWLL